MEQTKVVFGTLANEPNDYEHSEGDLSLAVNVVKHNGSLRVVEQGSEVLTVPEGYKLEFIHNCGSGNNYIFSKENAEDSQLSDLICMIGGTTKSIVSGIPSVKKITSVRMVLVISTAEGIRYARYVAGSYKYLGELPRMPYIYPFLQTNVMTGNMLGVDIKSINITEKGLDIFNYIQVQGEKYYTFTNNDTDVLMRKQLYETTFATLNECAREVHKRGCFYAPFYVRFAMRLHDGTYTNVSRPYPMVPSSTFKPLAIGDLTITTENGTKQWIRSEVAFPFSKLSIWIDKISQDWDGIVEGIDVFVSTEIKDYTDDETGIEGIRRNAEENTIESETDACGLDSSYQTCDINDSSISNVHEKTKYLSLFDGIGDYVYGTCQVTKVWLAKDGDKIPSRPSWGALASSMSMASVYENNNRYTYVYAIKKEEYKEKSIKLIASFYGTENELEPYGNNSTCTEFQTKQYNVVKKYIGENHINDYYIFTTTDYAASGKYEIRYQGGSCNVTQFQLYMVPEYVRQMKKTFMVNLKRKDGSSAIDDFENTGAFYKLCEIKTNELKDSMLYTPELNASYIDTITSKEVLKETSVRPYKFVSGDVYTYNNRVNAVVNEQYLENPDYIQSFSMGSNEGDVSTLCEAYVEVNKDGGVYKVKVPSFNNSSIKETSLRYFFYPDINATALHLNVDRISNRVKAEYNDTVQLEDLQEVSVNLSEDVYFVQVSSKQDVSVKLKKHDVLYGACAFSNFDTLKFENGNVNSGTIKFMYPTVQYYLEHAQFGTEDQTMRTRAASVVKMNIEADIDVNLEVQGIKIKAEDKVYGQWITVNAKNNVPEYIKNAKDHYHVGNKVLQSYVDNPFSYDAVSTAQIGCNDVYRICSATTPLSEGQFGDFPLYAFTDNGIWALKVSSDGSYSSVSPVSQDVVLNGESVTQLDQSILFVTKRGLMELQGSSVTCISEALKGHNFTDTDCIQSLAYVKSLAESSGIEIEKHIENWIEDAKILYDYKRQLLYVYHDVSGEETYNTGLVYSINDNSWGMYKNTLKYNCNSFTDAIAVGKVGNNDVILNMSETDDSENKEYNILAITRPIDCAYADIHKTVNDIVVRGNFGCSVNIVIWGSNDLRNWIVIGSSQNERWRNFSGTPYKYFRIAVISNNMKEEDSINSASISFTPRLNNKLR